MRIIGGIHRSRNILPPHDARTTRPITDRVKESLFNQLMARGVLGHGHALDLFAGTGSMGLEALSRELDHVTFVERDRKARQRLEQNITTLGETARSTVLGVDILSANWPLLITRTPVHLVFCDPPYAMTADDVGRARLATTLADLAPLLDPEALLILRTEKDVPPPMLPSFEQIETHRISSMMLYFYQPDTQGNEAATQG